MDEHLIETTLSEESIFDGKIVRLRKLNVRLPGGKLATREVVRHVGGAAVLAINDKGEACMVRQYRAALGRVLLEIPAGKLDAVGANPLEAARRELSEETGLLAADWTKLAAIYPTVGYCDELISIYLARGLSQGDTHPDDDEVLDILWMPFSTLRQMARDGQIEDGKTLVAVLAAPHLLGEG